LNLPPITSGPNPLPPDWIGSYLDREWEIVAIEEVKRRLSLDEFIPSNLPLPAGALSSHVLIETQLRQLVDVLPARAEGYPWHCIYSSDTDGYSLRTMYRKMAEFPEELSPVLVVIKDSYGLVFTISC